MSNQKEPASGKRRGIMIAAVAAFVILLAALVVCIVLLMSKREGVQEVQEPTTLQDSTKSTVLDRGFVDENNIEEIVSEMSEKVKEGMFECMMSTTWTFDDANSISSNAYVANVENNVYALYFDVYEEATNEVVYSSPVLPVGTEISNIKLEKALKAGEHDAVVMYTLVDENYEEVSTVGFKITIHVLK